MLRKEGRASLEAFEHPYGFMIASVRSGSRATLLAVAAFVCLITMSCSSGAAASPQATESTAAALTPTPFQTPVDASKESFLAAFCPMTSGSMRDYADAVTAWSAGHSEKNARQVMETGAAVLADFNELPDYPRAREMVSLFTRAVTTWNQAVDPEIPLALAISDAAQANQYMLDATGELAAAGLLESCPAG